MAALVCSIQVASNWLGRPLKKTTLGIEHIYIIAKILFRAKQILKIARDFEPALGEPRRARRAAKSKSHEMAGQKSESQILEYIYDFARTYFIKNS
jgi:hypothetical protein